MINEKRNQIKEKIGGSKHHPQTIEVSLCYTYLVSKKCGLDKSSPYIKNARTA